MTEKDLSEYKLTLSWIKCLKHDIAYQAERSEYWRELSPEQSEYYRKNADDCTADLKRCEDLRRKIESFIDSVEDETIKKMIVLRYINGYSWLKVSMELDLVYSADYCRVTVKRYLKKHGIT